jgi:hypothetical protein
MDGDTEMTPAEAVQPKAASIDVATTSTAAAMSDVATAVSSSSTAAAASAGSHAIAGVSSTAAVPPAAPALTPLQRVEGQLSQSLQHLWTSALIVEHGVAAPQPQQPHVGDEALERLMGMAQPKMTMQDITNQNLQRQMSDQQLCACGECDLLRQTGMLTSSRSVLCWQ